MNLRLKIPCNCIIAFLFICIAIVSAKTGSEELKTGSEELKTTSQDLNFSAGQNPYLTHAPLALFSLSSLAVGGIFYSLQNDLNNPRVGFVNRDQGSVSTAIGFAALTSLISGAAYFYYSNHDLHSHPNWDASVSSDINPDGKLSLKGIKGILTFPLSAIVPN